jgi:hypothetical protein
MKYFYDADRKGYLPIDQDRNLPYFRLVQCPRCGERRSDGVHVSTMDPGKSGSKELRSAWRKLIRDKSDDAFDRWPLYEHFASLLKQEFPGMYVSPSINFGIIDMEVDELVDIAGPGLGILVLKKEVFERLCKGGVIVDAWPVKARYTKSVKHPETYVELAAQPLASAAPGQNIRLCSVCNRSNYAGFAPGGSIRPCVLDASTVPANLDAFRIIEAPTNIIVTERFVNEVRDLDCGNILWTEVQMR